MKEPVINLAHLRKLRGLSQRDLAAMIDMDGSTIQRAESGHKSAKLETYIACADALGVTLSDIFCELIDPDEREFLRVFRAIPEQNRSRLRSVLDLAKAPLPPEDQ